MTFADVDTFAMSLPGVTVVTKWGHRTWMVGDRGFAWQRPFSKADLKRFGEETPPAGEILAVRVESLDAKDALLEIGPPGFFTIPHFEGYPGATDRAAEGTRPRRACRDRECPRGDVGAGAGQEAGGAKEGEQVGRTGDPDPGCLVVLRGMGSGRLPPSEVIDHSLLPDGVACRAGLEGRA